MVVIELDRNINFEFEIFPICLPKIATVGRDSRKGQIATVTGTVYQDSKRSAFVFFFVDPVNLN